jgi:hypothetical protein
LHIKYIVINTLFQKLVTATKDAKATTDATAVTDATAATDATASVLL